MLAGRAGLLTNYSQRSTVALKLRSRSSVRQVFDPADPLTVNDDIELRVVVEADAQELFDLPTAEPFISKSADVEAVARRIGGQHFDLASTKGRVTWAIRDRHTGILIGWYEVKMAIHTVLTGEEAPREAFTVRGPKGPPHRCHVSVRSRAVRLVRIALAIRRVHAELRRVMLRRERRRCTNVGNAHCEHGSEKLALHRCLPSPREPNGSTECTSEGVGFATHSPDP
jgi:hypothetical protein